eukprot:m.181405 g.181405  ORF g.181405 m.181405 type:complete len:62 (-) comp25453_c0_seq2:103-288(-)
MRPRRTFVELKQDRQRCTPTRTDFGCVQVEPLSYKWKLDLVEVSSDDDNFYSLSGRWKLMN